MTDLSRLLDDLDRDLCSGDTITRDRLVDLVRDAMIEERELRQMVNDCETAREEVSALRQEVKEARTALRDARVLLRKALEVVDGILPS